VKLIRRGLGKHRLRDRKVPVESKLASYDDQENDNQ
jgi:hypothetical protein